MAEPTRILVLDDESTVREPLCRALASASSREPLEIRAARTCDELLTFLNDNDCHPNQWDLVVVDLYLGRTRHDGIEVLKQIREREPDIPVVIVSDQATLEDASLAFREGATDVVERAGRGELSDKLIIEVRKLRSIVALAHDYKKLRERFTKLSEHKQALEEDIGAPFAEIVGQDPNFIAVLELARKVAPIPRPVLILGERGTGKELIARALHQSSPRGKKGPFVPVNCAAFEENVLASELFGHERGAFTSADRRRVGRFERADGGTLFLDEIGNMSLEFQKKILRVIEYPKFERVGGEKPITVDVRIVAATNVNLRQQMKAGKFLRDLFDRLAFELIEVPPLRNRSTDIVPLAQHFMKQFLREVPTMGEKVLSSGAVKALQKYHFPGNVRELKNIIERAVYRDTTNIIETEDLLLYPHASDDSTPISSNLPFKEQIRRLEKRLIKDALAACHGNNRKASEKLGLTYDQMKHIKKRLEI